MTRADSLGRHVDRILSLAVGPDSALWIGTEGNGLLRYHRGTYDWFTAAQGVPDRTIRALYVDVGLLDVNPPPKHDASVSPLPHDRHAPRGAQAASKDRRESAGCTIRTEP